MTLHRFDPSHSVKFDLGHGIVQLDGAGPRVLVPPDMLMDLCKHAGDDSLVDFGHKLGTEAALRFLNHLGVPADSVSVEAFVEHLGGNLALLGLGSLSVERWGKALVFVVDGSPLGPRGDALLAAVLEGALQRSLGREPKVVVLHRDDSIVRLLATGAAGARRAREWLAQGTAWGDVLARLHGGAA